MRKLISSISLTLLLTLTVTAAEPRGTARSRDTETPIERAIKMIKKFVVVANGLPSVPIT